MFSRTISPFVCATMAFAATAATTTHAAPLLWNQLGSAAEVTNSAYGPDLGFFNTPGSPTVRDIVANPAYVPGVFGNGVSIGPGNYTSMDREHMVVLENLNQHLNPNRGTIEVWYKQNADPVGFSHGVYRIFDGSYGLGSGMGFVSEHVPGTPKGLLYFGLGFAGTNTTVSHDISAHNGEWLHIAGVWDRDGIGGSADKLRLYLDGNVVASTTSAGWGNSVGAARRHRRRERQRHRRQVRPGQPQGLRHGLNRFLPPLRRGWRGARAVGIGAARRGSAASAAPQSPRSPASGPIKSPSVHTCTSGRWGGRRNRRFRPAAHFAINRAEFAMPQFRQHHGGLVISKF